jgi:hypothetical protein
MYFRGSSAAILVYDITTKSSFEALTSWIKELRQHGPENLLIVVVSGRGMRCSMQRHCLAPFWRGFRHRNEAHGCFPFFFLQVGNKVDLEVHRSVSEEEAMDWAENVVGPNTVWLETSAASGKNVNLIFETIGESPLLIHIIMGGQKLHLSRHASPRSGALWC